MISRQIRLFSHQKTSKPTEVPKYLQDTYWWAYIHPTAVWFFERQWIVNSILWGNFYRLREAALAEFQHPQKCLQVACVYGDFTQTLARSLPPGAELHVVDVAQIQLENLKQKLGPTTTVTTHLQDSSALQFADESFDHVVLFFLLHEMPAAVRKRTVEEAVRVLQPGGKCVFVDYHKPSALSPFRYVMWPVLHFLEPFALDLWREDIEQLLPTVSSVEKQTYFGGLYQKVVVTK